MARNKVLWHGSREGRGTPIEFDRRSLELELINAVPTGEVLGASIAIVYSIGPNSVLEARDFAEASIEVALDYGLFVMVLTETDGAQSYMAERLEKKGVPPNLVRYRTGRADSAQDWQLAQELLEQGKRSAVPSQLEIEVEGPELSAADRILIRRAFAQDCRKVRLVPLAGGKTADAFKVEATFGGSWSGPKPLPFFAKLGERRKILDEQEMYRRFATHYIPFHLRPNLHPDGCLLGFGRGILVGDFVDGAEPLWDAVLRGRAKAPIESLISETLGSWREQGFQAEGGPFDGPVADKLGQNIFNYRRVHADIMELARELGMRGSAEDMWGMLTGMTWQRCLVAPMHGDLHPNNVFVRQNDAILIDLASAQTGPLSGDLACLEVSLAFDHRSGEESITWECWRESVERLFGPSSFGSRVSRQGRQGEWSFRFEAAKAVRRIALDKQACGQEHMASVAMYLLRRGMFATEDEVERQRNAFAAVLAERLILFMRNHTDGN